MEGYKLVDSGADRIPKLLLFFIFKLAALKNYTIVTGTHFDLTYYAKLTGLKVNKFEFNSFKKYDLKIWAQKQIYASKNMETSIDFNLEELANEVGSSYSKAADKLHVLFSDWINKNTSD